MRIFLQFFFLTVLGLTLGACANQKNEIQPEVSNNQNEDTHLDTSNNKNRDEAVLADTFFFGCAYLDANENSVLDETDPKIPGATFGITLAGGGGFSGRTSEDNCAMVIIPGGLDESHWPVTARMLPPDDASYERISPADLLLEYPETHADFLFAQQ